MATLSEYELQRLKKIKRNEQRLAELGLDKAKHDLQRSMTAKAKTTAVRKRRKSSATANSTAVPQRSSRRLKRQPVLYEPLIDDPIIRNIDSSNFKRKKAAKTNRSKFMCEIPMELKSSPLNDKEKDIINKQMDGDFLGKFEDYLTSVDELSHQNRRNVLRQITKLHTGEGITYESKAYGWQEGCYFMKGKKIGPTDDIIHLMGIAQTCEDDWGQDRGNGWLLRHPLKKLYMFQQYCLR